MRFAGLIAGVVGLVFVCPAQQPDALMNARDTDELFARSVQLMEATTVAIPGMNRAAAPIIENARQAASMLKVRSGNMEATYSFLTNLRSYMLLVDSVPRPYPFPTESDRQLAELRGALARTEAHFRALIADRDQRLRSPDRDNLHRYAEANAKLGPPKASMPRVVFMGDSITDFWRLNEYFTNADFVNRGISGQISGEMLGRFKADVLDLKPAAVLILAGTNDLARGVKPAVIEDNYAMMADLADRYGVKVIFASVTPVSDYHKDQSPLYERSNLRPPVLIRALNDWLRQFTEQRGYVYLDYYSAMVDGAGMMKADLADDGLHPNSAGYRVMAPLAQAAIQRALGSSQQKTKARRLSFKGQ